MSSPTAKGEEIKLRGWVWRALGEVFILLPGGGRGRAHREQHFTHEMDSEHQESKLGNVVWGVETGSDLLQALIVFIL